MPSSPLTLMVAGTRSGSGKTTLALSLMAALHKRGLTVQAFKAGPDFIDPGYHAALTHRPSCNLDTWMAGEQGVRTAWERLLRSQPQPDVILGEGVMGLFDGAGDAALAKRTGKTDEQSAVSAGGAHILGGLGSTAHVAHLLHLPLLLVVDVRGMGQSAAALAHGFTSLQPDLYFAGIVCTHVGGPAHEALLREAFQMVFAQRIPLLGLMPRQGAPELHSRHLGLVMAHELTWDQGYRDSMARWLEQHMNVDALLAHCAAYPTPTPSSSCPPWILPEPPAPRTSAQIEGQGQDQNRRKTEELAADESPHTKGDPQTGQSLSFARKPRIGIARDEAFCFLYAHMPAVLEELGADYIYFSPLRDARLPTHCDALYFPGGYPELHAATLASNAAMQNAVRDFAASGRRIYGECGGYIYLMESVEVQGTVWPMSGCLPLRCRLEDTRAALGYREVAPVHAAEGAGGLECAGDEDVGPRGRGHEFHYCRLLEEPGAEALWQTWDRAGRALPAEGIRHGNIFASWVHLCPYGARELLAHIFQLTNTKENHAP